MNLRKLICLVAFLPAAACCQEMQVQLDPAATQVLWTLGDVLHTVHGTFKLKSGNLAFDPSTGKASGLLIVDALSGESGNSARDGRMHKQILESSRYPEIQFVPDRIQGKVNLQGDSDVQLHGAFTIHGATHELTMTVKSHIEQQKMTATITFPVPFVKWGMKNPSTLFLRVNDTVAIEIRAAGQVAASAAAAAGR